MGIRIPSSYNIRYEISIFYLYSLLSWSYVHFLFVFFHQLLLVRNAIWTEYIIYKLSISFIIPKLHVLTDITYWICQYLHHLKVICLKTLIMGVQFLVLSNCRVRLFFTFYWKKNPQTNMKQILCKIFNKILKVWIAVNERSIHFIVP